jgi:hypothetical protein
MWSSSPLNIALLLERRKCDSLNSFHWWAEKLVGEKWQKYEERDARRKK